MSDQQESSVRRVTKDDYYKVVDMFPPGEIYDGRDYLPDYFYMLIDMPNSEAYAVVIDDKFVSFTLYTIVDGGRTVVSRAMRTRKSYEGRGFNNVLNEWFLTKYSRREQLVYEIKTSRSQEHRILKKLDSKQRYGVLRRHKLNFIGDNRQQFKMELQHKSEISNASKLINGVELGELLTNQDLCNKLFQDGRLLVDRVPYRLVKSNACLIETERTTIVITKSNEHECISISFLNYYSSFMGFMCILDVYGEIDSILKEHLLIHFRKIQQKETSDTIIIRFHCDEDAGLKSVSDFMFSCNMKDFAVEDSITICTEQKIL